MTFLRSSQSKCLTLEVAVQRASIWRQANLVVAFTNGCFDILHRGHIHLLESARQLADVLIVGLNSDCSIRRIKGDLRPIRHQEERLTLLAALEFVDAVVLFEEDTPLSLIVRLQPSILIKGRDYLEDQIVGAREITGWGGRVATLPLLEGYSTTRAIAELQGKT